MRLETALRRGDLLPNVLLASIQKMDLVAFNIAYGSIGTGSIGSSGQIEGHDQFR
jgi:hypothetical protein